MRSLFAIAILSACSSSTPKPDAPPPVTNVEAVTCDATAKGPIITTGSSFAGMYSPNALSIAVGDNVQFMLASDHNLVPDAGGDANLTVDFGGTKCLKFKAAGDYKFHCSAHGFKGTVTVQ